MAQTLLLADDSVTIQRVIELTFADENIDVVAVGDGDQAIARIDSNPPDIVLADIGMPGRDGYEVAAHVKGSPRLMHIPVLLLTGAFEPVDQGRAAAVGSDGVLAKPFEPQLVIARVRELLAQPPKTQATLDVDLAPPSEHPANSQQLDEYFDRLDAAFANLSTHPPTPTAPPPPATPAAPEVDWLSAPTLEGAAPDLPLSYASPAPSMPPAEITATPDTPSTAAAPTVPPLPSVAPSAVPSLADAFAAILAAEQSEPASAPVTWPAAPSAAPEIGDAVVEEVTRRVLERLSDQVVRDTVGPIVSGVAERLIRDEIERIKASLR